MTAIQEQSMKRVVPSAWTIFGALLLVISVGLVLAACGMAYLFYIFSPTGARNHRSTDDQVFFMISVVAPSVGALLSLAADVLFVGKAQGNSLWTWISAGLAAMVVVPILLLTAILAYLSLH